MKKQTKPHLDPATLEYFREQGKAGGEKLKQTKPKTYYSDIVRKRWQKWREEQAATRK